MTPQLETDLRADPQDLDALKFVLNTIADISGMGMDIELSYLDTMERYRTLQQYGIPVPPDEMAKAEGIARRWQALFIEAKTKDLCLVKVKERFREVTKEQAVEFHAELKEMEVAFKASGPGNSNTELEDGMRLLAEYQQRVQVKSRHLNPFRDRGHAQVSVPKAGNDGSRKSIVHIQNKRPE